MTPEQLDKYYAERFSMMGTQGWKDFIDDVEEMMKATNTLNGVIDEKTLYFKRGEISIMNWILSLKGMSEESYEGLKNAPTL